MNVHVHVLARREQRRFSCRRVAVFGVRASAAAAALVDASEPLEQSVSQASISHLSAAISATRGGEQLASGV